MEIYGRAGQATDDNIIRRMRFTYWITKAADTHSEYVVLVAFPGQEWLGERASVLRNTHLAVLYLPQLACGHLLVLKTTWLLCGVERFP
jgi:hypothetical protein